MVGVVFQMKLLLGVGDSLSPRMTWFLQVFEVDEIIVLLRWASFRAPCFVELPCSPRKWLTFPVVVCVFVFEVFTPLWTVRGLVNTSMCCVWRYC
jgi:hypothetical protein